MITYDRFTPDENNLTPKMVTSVPITKRKLFTFILKAPGEVVWAGNTVEEALSWLRENDWALLDLISPSGVWKLQWIKPLDEREAHEWLGQQPPYLDLTPQAK